VTVSAVRRPGGRAREAGATGILAIVCAGVVLSSLDLFIVNVALPAIARDLHTTSLANLSWVLNAYAVVFAALLIPAGRLSDRSGRSGGFLLGVAIFTVGSACCAASTSVGMLVAFRVVQAVGAAFLIPTSLSLVLATSPAERRGRSVRLWAAMGGVAAALGPVVGGLLVAASWRWVFLVNVPIGLVTFVVGWRRLPRLHADGGPLPDMVGAAVLTVAIALLTLTLLRGGDWGWTSLRTVAAALATVVLAVGFVLRSQRHRSPVFPLGLLRTKSFTVSLSSSLFFFAAFGGMLLSVSLWLEDAWGWSALWAGLAIAPGPLLVLPTSLVANRIIARVGPGPVISAGCSLFALGVGFWAVAVGLHPDYVGDFLVGIVVTGVGVGLALPTLFSSAASSLPPQSFATGSAVVSMVRQIGFALGVAVFVAVLGSPHGALADLAAFHLAWFVIAGLSLAGAVAAGALPRRAGAAPSPPRRPPATASVTASTGTGSPPAP
jgi:EmrB/QacA subfamily drug resistance transporter